MSTVNSKRNNFLRGLALSVGLLFIAPSHGLNLNLQGIADLDSRQTPADPYYLDSNVIDDDYVYTNAILTQSTSTWIDGFTFIMLTDLQNSQCSDSTVSKIPFASNKYGIPVSLSGSSVDAYLVLSLNFHMALAGVGIGTPGYAPREYSGTFFANNANSGLRDNSGGKGICFVPNSDVKFPGLDDSTSHKRLTLSVGNRFELYTDKPLTPGKFTFKKPIYYGTGGRNIYASRSAQILFDSTVTVARVCKIKNVTNSNFDLVMNRENAIIQESRFQYTCTADNKAIYMIAVAREGTVAPSNNRKLYFNKIDGTPITDTTKAPWLLGLAYLDGASDTSLTCLDENKSTLLDFTGQEKTLGKNSVALKDENLNIKWAICSNDQVEAGKYKARVEVTVYTKV